MSLKSIINKITAIMLALGLTGAAYAQDRPVRESTYAFTGNGSSPECVPLARLGVKYHVLKWTTTGTVSAGNIVLQYSASSTCSSPSTLLTGTATSSGSSAITPFDAAYVRLTVTSYSGSGTITAYYGGYISPPAGIVGQGSTTSGQQGPLVQAAVTTSAPTYTNAQTAPLSLDTSGQLRVACPACAGGTQYAEDIPHVSGDLLSMAGAVRKDADGPLAADGDNSPLQVDENGFLKIAGTITDSVDNAAFPNTSTEPPVGMAGIYESSLPTYASGDKATLHLDVNGRLLVDIAATEDAVAGSGFSGVPFLAVRQDSQSDLAADGDFIPPTVDAEGGLRVSIINGSAGGTSIADEATFTIGSTAVTPIGGCYQASADSVGADNDAGCLRMTIDRKLIVTTGITDSADNAAFANTSTEPPVGVAGIYESSLPTYTNGDKATLHTDVNGRLMVTGTVTVLGSYTEDDPAASNPTGTPPILVRADALAAIAADGDNVAWRSNSVGAAYVSPVGSAGGGATTLSYISAGATEDKHEVKSSGGTLYSISATNTNAAVRYLKCENDTEAGTAPGTDTPEFRMAIPGATTGAGFTTSFPVGGLFSTGITCWIVTGAADSDVAEVAANEIMVFYTFK